MSADHNESNDLTAHYPEQLNAMKAQYRNWYRAYRNTGL
jgi:hypothetical protein